MSGIGLTVCESERENFAMLTRDRLRKLFPTHFAFWVSRRWVFVKIWTALAVAIALVALGYLLGRL